MLKLFRKKQYIFSINTGRAGSEYLAKILSTGKDVWADHEPKPRMIDDILDLVTTDTYANTYHNRVFKVKAIKKILRKAQCSNYIETNHMFIKTFYDVVIDKLEDVKVIFLKRSVVDTLNSFYELGYFSDRNEAWKKWMISPCATTSVLPCLLGENEKDEIGLAMAYILDIYARGHEFMTKYPNIPVYQINLHELNDQEKVKDLFSFLNIETTEATFQVVGKRENNRAERKKEIGSKAISKDNLKERLEIYIDRLEKHGISIKEMIEL